MPAKTAKAQPPANGKRRIEEEITNRILHLMDQSQLPPWEQGWNKSRHKFPLNAVSMKPYQGINYWMTLLTQSAMGYDDPRWLTYRQAQNLGGHVRKGETGTLIIFRKQAPQNRRQKDKEEEEGHNEHGQETAGPENQAKQRKSSQQVLRTYRVFNLDQTEGCQIPPLEKEELRSHNPIHAAQAIADAMPEPPDIQTYRTANYVPHYSPDKDIIHIPELGRYENPEEYYDTLFHELVHSTGHPERLARFDLNANAENLHAYGREEMTAAMGSAMLADHAGLSPKVVERDASYVRHWRDAIRADQAMVIRAASQAQKAVNAIRGENPPDSEYNTP